MIAVEKKRIALFDNLKYLLIVLVVFGHILEKCPFSYYPWHAFLNIIWSFHMPLFIFISGYFSKKVFDSNSIIRLLLIYLVFNYLYLLADYIFGVPVNSFGAPKHAMWYIFSLICWRCLLVIIPNRLLASLYIWLPISIVISVLSGFIPLYKGEFCLLRTMCFLPYFLGGFYCKQHGIIFKLLTIKKKTAINSIIVLALAYSIVCQPFMSRAFYVGYVPYKGIDMPVYESLICRLNSYFVAVAFSVFCYL